LLAIIVNDRWSRKYDLAAMSELPDPPARPRKDQRRGRPRSLDRAQVVEAALRVLDAERLDAVTIRRVAEELGTSGAALYTYVRDKEELVDLLLDRVLGEFDLGVVDPAQPWQEQLRAFVREGRRVFAAHADVARAALGTVPRGENSLRVANAMIGIMLEGEVPDAVAAFAVDQLSLYITAVAYEETLMPVFGDDAPDVLQFVQELRTYFESLPVDRFPHIVALAGPLTAFEPERDDRFEFGLDVLISGIEAKATKDR
jgi:AcrR family transcriptional regulator